MSFSEANSTEASAAAAKPQVTPTTWSDRLSALGNIPPLFRIVWKAAPKVVASSLACRVVAALMPVAMLAVTKVIIDSIYQLSSAHKALPETFWWLVGLQFALASLGTLLARAVDFCDAVLADKYTRYISTVIMTASLAASILFYSPWILLALVVCIVPAFLGETHFAFLGYSLNFRQTPAKREMEYLRILGGSKESAKELKLFGLAPYLVGRYTRLSDELHRQTVRLQKRKLWFGALLTLLGTLGYYGTYAYVIYQT